MPWSGIGSAVGGLFSMFGASQSSKRALQATRETNAQNYKIWQEQQQHNIDMFNMENQANIDMWNMQNEYNDPLAQKQRLANAGLNADMMMGNNASGVATSAPSSAHATPAGAPTMQQPSDAAFQSPWKAFADGALQGLVQVAQAFKLGSDTDLNKKQGDRIETLLPFEVNDLKESYGLKRAQAYQAFQQGDMYKYDAELNRLTQDFRVEYSKELTQFLKAQKVGQNLSNRSQQILNQFLPGEKQLQVLSAVGNILQQGATYRFTEAQIKTEIQRALDIGVAAQLKGEELKTYKEVAPSLIKDLISQHELNEIINQGGINYFHGNTAIDVPYFTYNKLYPYAGSKNYFHKNSSEYWRVRGSRPQSHNFNVGFKGFNVGYGITE